MKIAVVGGGVFGCTIAWWLSKEGHEVHLFEEKEDIFQCASGINQFRLHRGYHYPRSEETIISCINGEKEFREVYGPCVMGPPHQHYYAVAKEDSFLNAKECKKVWDKFNLKYKTEELTILNKDHIEECFRVEESVFDVEQLEFMCRDRLREHKVKVHLSKRFNKSMMDDFDFVVITAYAQSNELLEKKDRREYQFELVEKMVFRFPHKYKHKSVVIQDGPFTCIDPYGTTGLHLMGNVTHAIHHSNIGFFPEIPEEYINVLNNGIIAKPDKSKLKEFLDSAERYFPGISLNHQYIGSMFTIRTVLPRREHDDARPTCVKQINSKIISVFSGKIPTCVHASKEVSKIINGQ